MNTNMNDSMMVDAAAGVGKTGKGMMVGMIACAVLAVSGIGFGLYKMTQANSAKQQISDLKAEIKNQDKTSTTLETDKIESKDQDGSPATPAPDKIESKDDTNTTATSDAPAAVTSASTYFYAGGSKNYIYIGEWGIKIRIPETLKDVGYTFDNVKNVLYLYGRASNDTSDAGIMENFASAFNNHISLGAITIHEAGELCGGLYLDKDGNPTKCGIDINLDDGRSIQIRTENSQAWFSKTEEQKILESEAQRLLLQMASDPNNYSSI